MAISPQAARAYHLPQVQGWAEDQVRQAHEDSLYRHGEYALFTLMWTIQDYERGDVQRCQACYLNEDRRISEAYGQGNRDRCPECFGTTFEGGFRAQIIRPCLFSDANTDHTLTSRGEVVSETLMVDTVGGFSLLHGDYVFRADNTRYQVEEAGGLVIRTGYARPDSLRSIAGTVRQVRREDDKTAVCHLITPSPEELVEALSTIPLGSHVLPDLSAYENIRGSLIV